MICYPRTSSCQALKLSAGEQVVSSLKAEVPKPERRSRDVQKSKCDHY